MALIDGLGLTLTRVGIAYGSGPEKALRESEIEIPFPQRVNHMQK